VFSEQYEYNEPKCIVLFLWIVIVVRSSETSVHWLDIGSM